MRLLLFFLLIYSTTFSQNDTVRYECKLKIGKRSYLLKETLQLKPDSTYVWRSEYDLSFEIEGTYSITGDTLTLTERSGVFGLIKNPEVKVFYIRYDQLYFLNNRGWHLHKIHDRSLGGFKSWLKGYNFRYVYEKVDEFTFKD